MCTDGSDEDGDLCRASVHFLPAVCGFLDCCEALVPIEKYLIRKLMTSATPLCARAESRPASKLIEELVRDWYDPLASLLFGSERAAPSPAQLARWLAVSSGVTDLQQRCEWECSSDALYQYCRYEYLHLTMRIRMSSPCVLSWNY